MFDLASQVDNPIRLELGEPDFPTPEHIMQAAAEAMRRGATHYTPTAGTMALREAIAEKLLRENGIVVDPASQVIATVGAVSALALSIQVLVQEGGEVLIPDPGWPNYVSHVIWAGGTPVYVPLPADNGFHLNREIVARYLTPQTRAIIINSPGNPTGAVFTQEEIEGIAALCVERDIMLISDEVYEKILFDGHTHYSPASNPDFRDHVITINSFSKTYAMTGWRLGYAAGPAPVISAMTLLQEISVSCPNAAAQEAGRVALRGPQDAVADMVRQYTSRRQLLVDGLNQIPGLSCRAPEGSFYAFVNISRFGRAAHVAERLIREARIVTVPGTGFGPSGEGHVRLSFATSEENLREALRRLASWVKAQKKDS